MARASSGTSFVTVVPGGDVSPGADAYRRHQLRVAADEGARANFGPVASGSRRSCKRWCRPPMFGAFPDVAVAQVGQVVGFGAALQPHFLGFDEVAHLGVGADVAGRPQMREWADLGPLSNA